MHCRLNKIGNIFLKPQRKETEKKNKLSIKGCFLYANNIEKIKRDGYKYVLLVFFQENYLRKLNTDESASDV